MTYKILTADRNLFETGGETLGETVLHENEQGYVFEDPNHINFPDPDGYGCFNKYIGVPYLRRCVRDTDFLALCNIVKRYTLGLIQVAGSKEIILPGIGFALLPWKYKIRLIEKFLHGYCRAGYKTLQPCFWKDEKRWCDMVRELRKFIEIFLNELGITGIYEDKITLAFATAKIIGAIIEYDDSYRYRIQDLFTEVDKGLLLQNPQKEIMRIFGIYEKRERAMPADKLGSAAKGICFALRLPKIKRAFREAVKQTDFKKLGLDVADFYWAVKEKTNYAVGGMNDAQRQLYLNSVHGWEEPKTVEIRL